MEAPASDTLNDMNVSQDILVAALEGLELRRARLLEQIESVKASLGGPRKGRPSKAITEEPKSSLAPKPAKKAEKKGKRNLSPEARERIARVQKKRWAAARGETN